MRSNIKIFCALSFFACSSAYALTGDEIKSGATAQISSNQILSYKTQDLNAKTVLSNSNVFNGIDFATGWDSTLGRPKSSCVKIKGGAQIPKRSNVFKQDATLNAYKRSSEIITSFSSSIAASYDALNSGGNVGMSNASQGKYSDYKSYAYLENVVTSITPRILRPSDFELTDEAKLLLDTDRGVASWDAICGDSFIYGIHEGGRFEARLLIESATTEFQESITKLIEAYARDSSLDSEEKSKFKNLENESRLVYEVSMTHSGDSVPGQNLDEIVAAWRNFISLVKGAEDLDVVKIDYFPYLPYILEHLATNDFTLPPLGDWVLSLQNEFRYLQRLMVFKGDLLYMKQNPKQFVAQNQNEIDRAIVEVDQVIANLKFWAMNCLRTDGVTCDKAEPQKPIPGVPRRKNSWDMIINPRISTAQLIGQTMERPGKVELRGKFRFRKSPVELTPPTWAWSRLILRSTQTNKITHIEPSISNAYIPPYTEVSYQLWDDYWPDNAKVAYGQDQARARIGDIINLGQWQ